MWIETPQEYFIVWMGDDGLSIDGPFSKDEMLKRITPNPKQEDMCEYGRRTRFLTGFPERSQDWDGALLILRGNVIVPKPIDVVRKFDVP